MSLAGNIRLAALALTLLIPFSVSHADHPGVGLGGGVAGPVTALSAVPMRQNAWGLGLRLEYQNLEKIPDRRLSELSEAHEHAHGMSSLSLVSLIGNHGITDDLTIGLSLPYLRRAGLREAEHIHGGPDTVNALGDSKGLGDLRLYAQYRFSGDSGGSRHSAAFLGIKAPTGEEHETGLGGHHGDGEFGAEHQPGSGSWDGFIGLAHSRTLGVWSMHASLLYTVVAEGAQETDLGDSLSYDLAVIRRLGGEAHLHDDGVEHMHHGRVVWDAILELNGQWHEREKTAGVVEPNSGGDMIFLSPGLRATVDERWAVTLSLGMPVLSNPNGVHGEPDWRAIATIATGF